MEIIVCKYTHYPEIVRNVYNIVQSILKRANDDHLRKFLKIFDLNRFRCSFEIYKFNLRNFSKEINLFFINILYILVSFYNKKATKEMLLDDSATRNIGKQKVFKQRYFDILDQLNSIYSGYFDNTHRRYYDFMKKKVYELQIQDILLKIGSILMLYENNLENLIESDFMNSLIKYMLEFAYGKCEFKSKKLNDEKMENASKNKQIHSYDFIDFIKEKKKGNTEYIKRASSSIILSALEIYKNLLEHDEKYFSQVASNVINYK